MNQKIPFFSIIVPTYNRAALIPDTLRSLQQQTADNYEIIIVDDGSTDNTEAVVEPYTKDARVTYYRKNNAERGAARNYGVTVAKGDYVNFFDSDDLALPNHINEATKAVYSLQNPEVFHLSYQWVDTKGNIFAKCPLGGQVNTDLFRQNVLSCNGVFIRKDVANRHKFSEVRILSGSEDWELWMRLAANYPFHSVPVITSSIINHEGRSMIVQSLDRVIARIDALITKVTDPENIRLTKSQIDKIKAESYSLVALHAAATPGKYKEAIKYLNLSLKHHHSVLLQKRGLAIIKHLLTKHWT
jgi:glycosyltransferase involved in cell wall biosynthesis